MTNSSKSGAATAANGGTARAKTSNFHRPKYNPDRLGLSVSEYAAAVATANRYGRLIRESGVLRLVKYVKPAHMLTTPPAWALDFEQYNALRKLGATEVELQSADGGIWTAALDLFARCGWVFDRNHDQQIALPLANWHSNRPAPAAVTHAKVTPPKTSPLTLWDLAEAGT